MGKCNTVDDGQKWKSQVANVGEGDITINKEDGNGKFNGKHEGAGKNLNGKCIEASGKPPKIWFRVQGTKDLYVGVFSNDKKIEGLKLNLDEIGNAAAPLNGGEDWVAVKT